MRFAVVCDCHNTLVNSNEAWTKAFVDFLGEELKPEVELCLYGKIKRRDLAKKYKLDFTAVEKLAESNVTAKEQTVAFLMALKDAGIKLFVVSNAPRRRVVNDLNTANIYYMFEEIYSEEDGGKKNTKLFDNIISKYGLDYLLFIGNEEFDDHIDHPKVLCVAITSFLRKRFQIVNGYTLNANGIILDKGN